MLVLALIQKILIVFFRNGCDNGYTIKDSYDDEDNYSYGNTVKL